jgi:hypothetical protein
MAEDPLIFLVQIAFDYIFQAVKDTHRFPRVCG